jgi:hypothetical protein
MHFKVLFFNRGGFELSRTVRSPVLCEGLQAHLSCFASPKVLEVAKKFPSNVQLEELPRQNLWPPQFHDNGPTIDSIALFFFARDTESYEIHYRKLVENMLKDDLALRGNIETAELLIFASNTLPNNFQRNKFLTNFLVIFYLSKIFGTIIDFNLILLQDGTCSIFCGVYLELEEKMPTFHLIYPYMIIIRGARMV